MSKDKVISLQNPKGNKYVLKGLLGSEALAALLRKVAKGLSAGTISHLKQSWVNECDYWRTRDLSKESYVYIWADGIYFNIRSDDAKQCILVIIGVTSRVDKKFLAIEDGYRESEQSWIEVSQSQR